MTILSRLKEVSCPITGRKLCLTCRPAFETAKQNSSSDRLCGQVFPIQAAGSIPASKPSPREPGTFKTVLGHAKRRPAAKLYRKSAARGRHRRRPVHALRLAIAPLLASASQNHCICTRAVCITNHESKHGWLPQASIRKTTLRRNPLLREAT